MKHLAALLLAPLLACSPNGAAPKDETPAANAKVMDPQLREVYRLRLHEQPEQALALATKGEEESKAAGDDTRMYRFGCARAILLAELGRQVLDADTAAWYGAARLKDGPKWILAECALAAAVVYAVEMNFEYATAAAKHAFKFDKEDPHPDPERRVAIKMAHALMVSRDDLEAGEALALGALTLQEELGEPACPNRASTMLAAAGVDVGRRSYTSLRKTVAWIEERCDADTYPLLLARAWELRALASLREGDARAAIDELGRGHPVINARGTAGDRVRYAALLAEAHDALGEFDVSRAILRGLMRECPLIEIKKVDKPGKWFQDVHKLHLGVTLLLTEAHAGDWPAVLALIPEIEQDLNFMYTVPVDAPRRIVELHRCRALLHTDGPGAQEACAGQGADLEAIDPEAAARLKALAGAE